MGMKPKLAFHIGFFGFIVLLVVVGIVWVFTRSGIFSTNTSPTQDVPESPKVVRLFSIEDVQKTSLEDAKTAFDNKEALFVDVRSSPSYAGSHIPGAISIPEDQVINHVNELDPYRWIITYCS